MALAALTGMALYNAVSNRLRDRGDLGDQIADLSRGTADLARQVAEISPPAQRRGNQGRHRRRNRARAATDPIAAEIGELGGLVKQIAETVAAHADRIAEAKALYRPAPLLAAPNPTIAPRGRRRARAKRERRGHWRGAASAG